MKRNKLFGLILGPFAFILIQLFFHPDGLNDQGRSVLASAIWIAIWWVTEAIPIAATALLPIVLFPLSGGMSLAETTPAYGHKFVFLYLGGFIIALAIEKWQLHKRIALNIINFVGTNVRKIILGFMLATAFLSMWISNTATSVMMLPIGMAIIDQLKDNPNTIANENKIFGKALMLAIAYSASIGGIATLIGTPPNLVLAGVVNELYGYEITFTQWFMFGFPISCILLAICWVYITRFAFSFKQNAFPGGKEEIKSQLKSLGQVSYEEKVVGIVFGLAAFSWISRSFLLQKMFPALDDTIIAILFSLILFIIPSKNQRGALMKWNEAVKLPWGIILLFGGGMTLANGFEESGLALFIGEKMAGLSGLSTFLIILIIVASVNFLTEITSNLATTAMLLPVLAPMALSIDMHPFALMTAVAVAASCAFMLPVATPPNAVVFGSGYLKIPDMARKGFIMNVISILLLSLFVYFLLPAVWDIVIEEFPKDLIR